MASARDNSLDKLFVPLAAASAEGRQKMRATKLVSISVTLCAVVVGADNASAGGVNVPTVNVPRVNVPKPTVSVPKVIVPRKVTGGAAPQLSTASQPSTGGVSPR